MLDNLKLVLLQHKKFLIIFFVVIFLPSVVLAFLGVRAIYNERYKLQQQTLEQQKAFVQTVKGSILSRIERNTAQLGEIAAQEFFVEKDYRKIHDLVLKHIQNDSLIGQIVIWNGHGAPWFPEFQSSPPLASTIVMPDEWTKWQPDLEIAERAEFRLGNYSEAVSLYKKILDRAKDSQVKAWLLSRIARCEAKREKFDQALNAYRAIIVDFPDFPTESGRPLELASRLEILDALRLSEDREIFFRESLNTYSKLEQNTWFLDGDQIKVYSDVLKNMIDEVMGEVPSENLPEDFARSIVKIEAAIHKGLDLWKMAEVVKRDILPASGQIRIRKHIFEYGGDDILVILASTDLNGLGQYREYMGSLIRAGDLTEAIETRIDENGPLDASIVLRSSLSHKIVLGDAEINRESLAVMDFFPDNFPPWRLELYRTGNGESGFALHKNIFFWTILALLVIVVFGSTLIIRSIVQEVNLLNLKSEFIASVSHEFKTPLTAMGAVLERLLSDEVKDPKKTREYYRILSHDSERLRRLVKNVLDFTKIEDRKREYKLAAIDIVRLVRREVECFQNEIKLTGTKLDTQIDDVFFPVFADEEAMSQALHNILDNAAKFSGPEKNIRIEINRRQDSVEIAVEDRGVGIPENEQKKIFEKFYRGKKAGVVSPTGTGLGLTLVKHIMDAHSGDIIIKSRPGTGTRVSLILPIGKGD